MFDHLLMITTGMRLEPGIKVISRGKDVREQKVEEGPQLVQVVLQGSARDEEATGGVEFTDDDGQFAGFILDAMCFINDQVLPVDLAQGGLLTQAHLITSDAQVKVKGGEASVDEGLAVFLRAVEDEGPQARNPSLGLISPILESGLGHHQ